MALTLGEIQKAGGLVDGSPSVETFRSRLKAEFTTLAQFSKLSEDSMAGATPTHRAALQDCVNGMAHWIGFKVEFGTYGVNLKRPIQFDGFWQSRTGNSFLFYLRTPSGLRVEPAEIVKTLKRLNTDKQAAAGVRIFALVVAAGLGPDQAAEELPRAELAGRCAVLGIDTLFGMVDRTMSTGRGSTMLEKMLLPHDPLVLERRLPLIDACLEVGSSDQTIPGLLLTSQGPARVGTKVGASPTPLSETFPDVRSGAQPLRAVARPAAAPGPNSRPARAPEPPAPPPVPVPSGPDPEELRQQARLAEEDGRASEALEFWTQLLGILPTDAEAIEGAQSARKFLGLASPTAKAAVPPVAPGASGPSGAALRLLEGWKPLMEQGRFAEALPLLEAAVQASPKDPRLLEDLAIVKGMTGDRAGCQACFARAAQASGNELDDFRRLSQVALRSGEADTAVDIVVTFLTRNPDDPRAYMLLGEMYSELGRSKDAVEAYENAVNLAPSNAQAHAELGRALVDAGQAPRGEASLASALEVDPGCALAWAYRGEIRRLQHDPTGARTAYEKARQIDPECFPARLGLAHLLEESGRVAEATAAYEALLKSNPSDRKLQGAVLRALNRGGQSARALEIAGAILAKDPRNVTARIHGGLALYQTGQVPAATQALEEVLQVVPEDPQVLLHLGLCYFSALRYEEAVEALEESTRHDPALVAAYLYLGYSYRQLGNGMDAALNFTKVLNLEPENEAAKQGMLSLG